MSRRKRKEETRAPARTWGALAGWMIVGASAGVLATFLALQSPRFVASLYREWWVLRTAWFGPLWTLASALSGVAAWFVWRERGSPVRETALGLFLFQVVVAATWALLHYRWHRGPLAFADLLLLVLLVAATIAAFWRVRPLAGALLLPYLAWVLYATAAGYRIWRDNRGLLP